MRHQELLLGPVASPPTVWRALSEITPAMLARVERARARAGRHVGPLPEGLPPRSVAGGDLGEVVVLENSETRLGAPRRNSALPRRAPPMHPHVSSCVVEGLFVSRFTRGIDLILSKGHLRNEKVRGSSPLSSTIQ